MGTLGMVRRYRGVVASVPQNSDYGFISVLSLVQDNGDRHNLSTQQNLFIHQDDCAALLRVGMTLSFEVVADTKREGCFRAQAAVEVIEGEVIKSTGIPGFGMTTVRDGQLIVHREIKHPWSFRAKKIDPKAVAQAEANQPLAGVPRGMEDLSPDEIERRMQMLMATLYPQLMGFGTDFNVINVDDTLFDEKIEEVRGGLRDFGMLEALGKLNDEIVGFKGIRTIMKVMHEDGLIRPDTFIPMKYLPDMFMACPVWFEYRESSQHEDLDQLLQSNDPRVADSTLWFCDQLPNDRWADVFQMFNRRVRSLHTYRGDTIPPKILNRLKMAVEIFDHVVIATPYLDIAGMEWNDPQWMRQIDPYVIGFKDGLPVFFVLGRFSDSGIFPLFSDMVADTMDFVRNNVNAWRDLDKHTPFWYTPSDYKKYLLGLPESQRGGATRNHCHVRNESVGTRLVQRGADMQTAFKAGHLFDWLRGEWHIPSEHTDLTVV